MPLRIAVTLGDPRGIGPEVVRGALAGRPLGAECLLIGPPELLAGLPGEHVPIPIEDETGSTDASANGTLPVSPEVAGRVTGRQVERAVALAMAGDVHAIVTGPAEKAALNLAGYQYPGHTELLGALAGAETAMMLLTGALRVVLLTTHIPLRAVPSSVTAAEIERIGNTTRRALAAWWGIDEPRLALCAMNPHAGEGGLFGDEDLTVLAPAARKIGAAGPFSADTVFVRALKGEFDAVLTPAHDVGMTAVKVAGFGSAVNVTLGLPFIRTAPDHGTAFDIAGKGVADAGSMREAISLAVSLANRVRQPA